MPDKLAANRQTDTEEIFGAPRRPSRACDRDRPPVGMNFDARDGSTARADRHHAAAGQDRHPLGGPPPSRRLHRAND